MRRRLNYTGRVKINRSDVFITVQKHDEFLILDADLKLNDYGLPVDSKIFIEAYRQTTWMRFHFGTVGNPQKPTQENRILSEFDSEDGILFRVKVTQGHEEPILLAAADWISLAKPEGDADRESLLPVQQVDLGNELWRISLINGPLLQVNKSAGLDMRQISLSPIFLALVYPAALRQILNYILIVEKHEEKDDNNDWHSKWLRFASMLPGMDQKIPDLENEDEVLSWIDQAGESFAKRFSLKDQFISWYDREYI